MPLVGPLGGSGDPFHCVFKLSLLAWLGVETQVGMTPSPAWLLAGSAGAVWVVCRLEVWLTYVKLSLLEGSTFSTPAPATLPLATSEV